MMIEVSNLVFEYPGKRALHGLNFSIEAATVTALVGPNGAGKTTLLRCLAALERPFSGRVELAGIDTTREPRQVHRQLGYLSDFFGLYDDLSVRRCLTYAALARGVGEDQLNARVERAAMQLEITDRLEQRASNLSRGLRQRLAIAQAIIHQPRVLLLDEPASGLDPEARISLSRLLSQLRGQGMTLVVSSHILAELESYSTHMLMMREGRITGHRALEGFAPRTASIRLRLVAPDERLGAVLVGAGVSDPAIEGATATFSFSSDPDERCRLLSRLLAEGLAVYDFAETKQSMEEVYLRDMQHRAEGRV